jgi:hypothetical protein
MKHAPRCKHHQCLHRLHVRPARGGWRGVLWLGSVKCSGRDSLTITHRRRRTILCAGPCSRDLHGTCTALLICTKAMGLGHTGHCTAPTGLDSACWGLDGRLSPTTGVWEPSALLCLHCTSVLCSSARPPRLFSVRPGARCLSHLATAPHSGCRIHTAGEEALQRACFVGWGSVVER